MGKIERDLRHWADYMHIDVRTITCENEAFCPVFCIQQARDSGRMWNSFLGGPLPAFGRTRSAE